MGGAAENRVLLVLDLDLCLIGEVGALCDRDNLETNIPWEYWPHGMARGVSVDEIARALEAGLLRPGVADFLRHVHSFPDVLVAVYTHSQRVWASKVLLAMARVVGVPRVATHVFCREDCNNDVRRWPAEKSLSYITAQLRALGETWVCMGNTVMLDDRPLVLCWQERARLVHVPPYTWRAASMLLRAEMQPVVERASLQNLRTLEDTLVEWGYGERDATGFVVGGTHPPDNNARARTDDYFVRLLKRIHCARDLLGLL